MRRPSLLAAVAALLAIPVLFAWADDPLKELPKPPTTPLPTFENPLFDAQVGETLLYKVRELEGRWTRYFEERVLARTKDEILLETVETDATGTKTFGRDPDPRNTGWKPLASDMKLGSVQKWVKDRQKDDVLYVGDPAKYAVRCTRRVIEEPEDLSRPEGKSRQREIWYSHDVPCTGRVRMFPAQQGGERMALSWEKKLSAEECAKRAANIKKPAPDGGGTTSPEGMADPAMGEPGMDDPSMGEPGMGEPGMADPKDGGMDDGGMKEGDGGK